MKNQLRDLRDKYFQIDDEYINGYAKLCGINATGVYLSLCRHANKEQQCFPSKKLISEELAISERSVYTALKILEDWNIIHVDNQGRKKDGSFKVKLYSLMDKKNWVSKPQATGADGKIQQSPQANDNTTRRQLVPNKETHIKETQEKERAETSSADIPKSIKKESSKSMVWEETKSKLKLDFEKNKDNPKFQWPTKDGIYDWRYLYNYGNCTPDKYFGVLYWKLKEELSGGIYKYKFETKEEAWATFQQESKSAVQLANAMPISKFKKLLDLVNEKAWDEKTESYSFDWKLTTCLKSIHEL